MRKNFVAIEHHSCTTSTCLFTFSVVVVDLSIDCILSFLFPAETFSFQSFPSQQTSSSWTSSWFLSSLLTVWKHFQTLTLTGIYSFSGLLIAFVPGGVFKFIHEFWPIMNKEGRRQLISLRNIWWKTKMKNKKSLKGFSKLSVHSEN